MTRALCRAGRAASAKAMAGKDGGPKEACLPQPPRDGGTTPSGSGRDSDLLARKAGAVAEAIENVARRHARGVGADMGTVTRAGSDNSVTLTSALRSSGVSTMINMHLALAERALSANKGTVEGSKESGHSLGKPQTWVWSQAAPAGKLKGTRAGTWVAKGAAADGEEASAGTAGVGVEPSSSAGLGEHEAAVLHVPPQRAAGDRYKGAGPVESAGAECRRAVAAVIESFDAGRVSGAAQLSIGQWKVVTVVLLTAIGLGGGEVESCGELKGGGGGVPVRPDETSWGAEACRHLCGKETLVSQREFHLLVEVLLEE